MVDLHGHTAQIPFYLTRGDGFLLLGNEILHSSYQNGPENVLHIPSGVCGLSSHDLEFQTYFEPLCDEDPNAGRTYLLVIPAKLPSFRSFLSPQTSLVSSRKNNRNPVMDLDRKAAQRFAAKLHGYTHLSAQDMETICKRASVLTPLIKDELQEAYQNCTSCQQTGRPVNSRKISFSRILSEFNDTVQIDFFFVSELSKSPILHFVDVSTAFSAAQLMDSREMDNAVRSFESQWINIHGAPTHVSADVEFLNKFAKQLHYFGIKFKPTPARRHNKLGVVERKNSVVRLLIQRLVKDGSYASASRAVSITPDELLSRATYLSNILYGSKLLSSFELARGYTPSISGLPASNLTEQLVEAHHEQAARRALHIFEKSKVPRPLQATDFEKDQEVYFFKRGPKFGTWEVGWVRDIEDHALILSSNKRHRGKSIRSAYEDVRKVPSSPLLRVLDSYEFFFPRSSAIVLSLNDVPKSAEEAPPEIFPDIEGAEIPGQLDDPVAQEIEVNPEVPADDRLPSSPSLPEDLGDLSDAPPVLEEELDLWGKHPTTSALLVHQKPRRVNTPAHDIGSNAYQHYTSLHSMHNGKDSADLNQTRNPSTKKDDIGKVPLTVPPELPYSLKSSEQLVLRNILNSVGSGPFTEFQLQFAPRWLLNKSISQEKVNYKDAYEEVDIRTLSRSANIISSHHFFEVKNTGTRDSLKLKCRLVPHGNRDKDKDKVRKDSATAQFCVIRIVLSIAALFNFPIASIDIKSAYLQGGTLPRDVYMRPPKGWSQPWHVVWKLLRPAYGLTESGRLWQLVIESWLTSHSIDQIPGLPQLFVKRTSLGTISLALVKVVDDLLIVGPRTHIDEFHTAIAARFVVGRFLVDQPVVFNGLNIHRDGSGSVHYSMKDYFQSISPIDITRSRRKEQLSPCTPAEITSYLQLTGSLNWLGHGALPQAGFAASHLQQAVGRLTVSHIVTANKVLQELKALSPSATLLRPSSLTDPSYLALSDASQGSSSYGQTGYISGLYLPAGGSHVFHVLDWHSSKQSRVAFSSIGAEILAAATSTDRGALMAERHQVLYGSSQPLPFILTVDSNGLYSTITTLHEGHDYRLRPTVSRIRDSYENGEISVMQWIPGKFNLADALTKRNLSTYKQLNDAMVNGCLPEDILKFAKRVNFKSQLATDTRDNQ